MTEEIDGPHINNNKNISMAIGLIPFKLAIQHQNKQDNIVVFITPKDFEKIFNHVNSIIGISIYKYK